MILGVIADLVRSREITMVIVTHEVDFAMSVAGRIGFMEGGTLSEICTPQQIRSGSGSDRLKRFFKKLEMRGKTIDFRFDDGAVHLGDGVAVRYDAVEGRSNLFWVDFMLPGGTSTSSLVLDMDAGTAVIVNCSLLDECTNMRTTVGAGTIAGVGSGGPVPAPTDEMVGHRLLAIYEDDHVIEWIIHNSKVFGWHMISGMNGAGHGAFNQATYWKLRDQLYLVAFVETNRPETV